MPLDLDAYLRRVGYAGELAPTPEALRGLHLAHATHIPFENLDVLLGRPVLLQTEALEAKLVRGRRGGYCFEQNLLFAEALERLGFRLDRLAARVRFGAHRVLPRTHMLLRVEAGGGDWLADVGFGGEGLLLPVAMAAGEVSEQFAWAYRVVEEGGYRVLQSRQGDGWSDLYVFGPEPQHRVDFEVANYYVSTHPSSRFTQTLTVQLPTPEARYVLRGRELVIDRGRGREARAVEEGDLLGVLRETFGLAFPPGTRFAPAAVRQGEG
jgi:N-hydroxyarylamine O-acetyltransferase